MNHQILTLPEGVSLVVAQNRGDDIIITCIGTDQPHWSVLRQFEAPELPRGVWWVEIERLGAGGLRISVMEESPGRPEGRHERSQLYINREGRLPMGPTRIRKRDLAVLLAAIPPEY